MRQFVLCRGLWDFSASWLGSLMIRTDSCFLANLTIPNLKSLRYKPWQQLVALRKLLLRCKEHRLQVVVIAGGDRGWQVY